MRRYMDNRQPSWIRKVFAVSMGAMFAGPLIIQGVNAMVRRHYEGHPWSMASKFARLDGWPAVSLGLKLLVAGLAVSIILYWFGWVYDRD